MFDPHQLQKNILQDNLAKHQNYNLMDFAEEDIVEDNSPTKF